MRPVKRNNLHTVGVFATLALMQLLTIAPVAASGLEARFGHPYIFADRIVFTSADGTHLIALDKKGQLKWELAFSRRIFEQRTEDDGFLVQSGQDVYWIDASTGQKSGLRIMPENELLIVGFDKSFLAAADSRFDHKHIRFINSADGSTLWESDKIESLVDVTPSTIIAEAADRKYDDKDRSYQREREAICGFDRKTGLEKWSLPLSWPAVTSMRVGKYLVVVDMIRMFSLPPGHDRKLIILNPDTGEVLSQREGNFDDLWPLDDSMAVFEGIRGTTQSEFYLCTLPSCAKGSSISLFAREILTVRLYGNYIITAGLYDSACFSRSTGKRLWEKGSLEWSEPFDDQMIVTDYARHDRAARIVSIDLATGKERVLFSRTVTEHDRADFKPW
jgi:outer membrane protein assembly factor BamB